MRSGNAALTPHAITLHLQSAWQTNFQCLLLEVQIDARCIWHTSWVSRTIGEIFVTCSIGGCEVQQTHLWAAGTAATLMREPALMPRVPSVYICLAQNLEHTLGKAGGGWCCLARRCCQASCNYGTALEVWRDACLNHGQPS